MTANHAWYSKFTGIVAMIVRKNCSPATLVHMSVDLGGRLLLCGEKDAIMLIIGN